uniref:Reverse transcriptase domain-containing protein n=1 Tax=Cyprinus carpio carpio TaxID=630221 RepID=A0A9J8AIQ2_CYPCA
MASSMISSQGGDITLASWNVRGLNSQAKRAKVFSYLRSISADIFFLQETHIKNGEQNRLKCNWISQVFQSTFTCRARGVSILFRNSVPFKHISTLTDPNGRYVLVTGIIASQHFTFLNLYAPNYDDPAFFRKVFNLLPSQTDTHFIVGGDFNCILDPVLDKFPVRSDSSLNSTSVIKYLSESLDIVDIWRVQHPADKEYSFFSNVHKSYSRIDFFFIDSKLLSNVSSSKYHNILISDHSAVTVSLDFGWAKPSYNWRFNTCLLSDEKFSQHILDSLTEFIDINDKGDVSDSVLWETFKVVMRGHIISYESAVKKHRQKRLVEIDARLAQLEKLYRDTTDSCVLNDIRSLKYEYNKIMSDQVNKMLIKIKQKHFEIGDKPDKLLARQLRGSYASRSIHSIADKDGKILTNPKDINKRFMEFFADLYKSKTSVSSEVISDFLRSLSLPKLSEADQEILNADITIQELMDAINAFPNGKAPGPDGFSFEFYKKYADKIVPLMLRMFNHSFIKQEFPSSLYSANISLLLKKGKDETDVSSFRPISLLNSDLKVFTKILATRLNKCISTIIHPDQVGFIPKRFSFFNVRRFLNIIYSKLSSHSKLAIIALDAEKAFDQVEWNYILTTIKEFNLGDRFSSWVSMLYHHPCASVLTNLDRSPQFELHRGTRQGCPLSPLLFAIAIEPLAIAIRLHPQIPPLNIGQVDHIISLYADDVLLYLSDPERSVPPLLGLLNSFSSFSGYSVNWQKSELMPVSDNIDPVFMKSLPFKITLDKIKYLGVVVPKNPKDLVQFNFFALLDNLKKDIERWRSLPISMIGRINAIKMVILPRFLYLFLNLPFFLPKSFFRTLDSIIIPFIWGYKVARISKTHVYKPKCLGGLGLPNFRHYYWAANCRTLMYWRDSFPGIVHVDTPSWLAIEQNAIHSSLSALLFSAPLSSKEVPKTNLILKNSIKIWYQIRKVIKLPNTSLFSPICYNHAFKPSLSDNVFREWQSKGILIMKDLYINNTFPSFSQFSERFDLPSFHFFRYLQVRNFVRTNFTHFEILPLEFQIFDLFSNSPDAKGIISLFVNVFKDNTNFFFSSFENSLGRRFGDSGF